MNTQAASRKLAKAGFTRSESYSSGRVTGMSHCTTGFRVRKEWVPMHGERLVVDHLLHSAGHYDDYRARVDAMLDKYAATLGDAVEFLTHVPPMNPTATIRTLVLK